MDPSNIYKSFQTQTSIQIEKNSFGTTGSKSFFTNLNRNGNEKNNTELIDVNVDIEQILNDFEVSW